MRDRRKRNITIISLCCLLVFMAVGYAVLSQQLNINGTANLTGEWNIYIESITATKENGNGISKSAIVSEDKLSAEFLVELEKPGDYVEYNVVVTNGGNIDASLRELITEETMPHKDIKFSHTAKQGEVLTQKTSTEFTVKVEFDRNATTVIEGELATYKIRLNYEQYEGNKLYAPPKVDTDNSCFKINAEGTITDYDENCGTYVTIPEEIDGVKVKSIAPYTFAEFNAEMYIEDSGKQIAFAYDRELYDAVTELFADAIESGQLSVYLKSELTDEQYENIVSGLSNPTYLKFYMMLDGTRSEDGKPYVEYLDLSKATSLISIEKYAFGSGAGKCVFRNPLKQVNFGNITSLTKIEEANFSCMNIENFALPKSVVDLDVSYSTEGGVFYDSNIKNFEIYTNDYNTSYPFYQCNVENLEVHLGELSFAYNEGFTSVTNATMGEGITGFNIPYQTQKLVVPSTVLHMENITSNEIAPREIIFMHKVKPSFYGDTSWYDPSVTTVTYPNID